MTGVRGAAVAAPLASLPVAVYCPSELMIASFQEMRCSESLVEGRLAADSVNGCLDFDSAADANGYPETAPSRRKVIIKAARREKVGETMRPSNVGRSAGRVLGMSRRAGRSTLIAGEGFQGSRPRYEKELSVMGTCAHWSLGCECWRCSSRLTRSSARGSRE